MRGMAKYRWSIRDLLKLQLMLVPLFMSPFYSRPPDTQRPYMVLVAAIVVPPVIYSGILSFFALLRQNTSSSLFVGIRAGGFYGTLFCVLALGPLGVPYLFQQVQQFLLHVQQLPADRRSQSARCTLSPLVGHRFR